MALDDLTDPAAVLSAIAEFDEVGRPNFIERYGFRRAFNYFLVFNDRLYDSKAIVGAAHGFQFPNEGPLRAGEFSGGFATVQQKLQELGFTVRFLDGSDSQPEAYWWDHLPTERFWVEIRRELLGLGVELRCPFLDIGFERNAWYDLVDQVQPGDRVYHWNAREERFVGRSIATAAREIDQETGERILRLRDFVPLQVVVGTAEIQNGSRSLRNIRHDLAQAHPGRTLFMPFQFRSDGLRLMSNYFTKLPVAMQTLLFGTDGLAEGDLPNPPPEDGAAEPADGSDVQVGFLKPFKAKADTDYLSLVPGGRFRRGRKHETLVNDFASWLAERGLAVGRNAAIDLGLNEPPAIIEAKNLTTWPKAIREAVGQLYEYRYFEVARPDASLIFLASEPVPEDWTRYLEQDRRIGVAWRVDGGFVLSSLAAESLGLPAQHG